MNQRIQDYHLSDYEHGFAVERVVIVPPTGKDGKPNKGAGTERRTDPRYFGNIAHAVHYIADKVACKADNLSDFLLEYQRVLTELQELIGGGK